MWQEYPFDCQDCTLSLFLKTRQFNVTYRKNPERSSSFASSGMMLSEWELLAPTEEMVSEDSKNQFNIYIRLRRRPNFIVLHIMFPVGMITMLTWLSYCIPVADVGDRLSCGLTLLLTSVAFKFIVSDKLPDLSYTTFCDDFMLATMILQMMVCVQCGSMARIFDANDPNAKLWDDYFAAGSFTMFVMTLILFFFRGWHSKVTAEFTHADRLRIQATPIA